MYKIVLFFLIVIYIPVSVAQTRSVTGKVTDALSKKPLAFVNVSVEGTRQGSVSDIDGKFSVSVPAATKNVTFSYVGYETYTLLLTDSVLNLKSLTIQLKIKDFSLKEFTIVAGENPAYRIIRQAIKNAPYNNPEKKGSFSYTSYNKMVFNPKIKPENDSLQVTDTAKSKIKDLAEKRHLFMMESVSQRNFLNGLNNEKILASRVSGLKNPSFSLLATQMQSFSFYGDYIAISEKKYLNPLSSGSIGRYEFSMEDTVFSSNDSIYIISFFPRPEKNFEGLKGLLYINTNLYAIQNVIAEPAVEEMNFHIKIQQKYEWINDSLWFPVQLNTDITYKMIKIKDYNITGTGRSYINDIKINPQLEKKQFNRIEIEIADDAAKKDAVFWNKFRKDTLTTKELTTYQVIDSIGKEEKLDLKLKVFETLLTGKIPAGYFDFDLNRFLNFNDYEGFRLGAGIHTSSKFSEILSAGGYFAYGFKDKAIKYGADAFLTIHKDSETKLGFFWLNDVKESAGINFVMDRKPAMSENYRPLLISRMDSIQQQGITLEFRAAEYFKFSFTGSQSRINPTGSYQYGRKENDVTMTVNHYDFTELTAGFRFAFREKFIKTPRYTYSMGTEYPVIWVQVKKGFDNILAGSFDYLRIDLKAEKNFVIKQLGTTSLQFISGTIDKSLPYTALYAGRGSFKNYSVSVMNTFETMGMNEFVSSTYLSFFLNHNFGSLLFSRGKFKPEIVLVSSAGWGRLNNANHHFKMEYKTMEQGYYESGLKINNLITSGFSGIGAGAFYRYGPYSNAGFKNNVAAKLTFSVVF